MAASLSIDPLEYSKEWFLSQAFGILFIPMVTKTGTIMNPQLGKFLCREFPKFEEHYKNALNEYGVMEYLKERFQKLPKEELFSLLSGPIREEWVHDSLKVFNSDKKCIGYVYGHLRCSPTPICRLFSIGNVVAITLPVGGKTWNPGMAAFSLRTAQRWINKLGRALFPLPTLDINLVNNLLYEITSSFGSPDWLILAQEANTPVNMP